MTRILFVIALIFISKLFIIAQVDTPLGMPINSKLRKNDTIYCIIVPNKKEKKEENSCKTKK